jgi:hypothetical protein
MRSPLSFLGGGRRRRRRRGSCSEYFESEVEEK